MQSLTLLCKRSVSVAELSRMGIEMARELSALHCQGKALDQTSQQLAYALLNAAKQTQLAGARKYKSMHAFLRGVSQNPMPLGDFAIYLQRNFPPALPADLKPAGRGRRGTELKPGFGLDYEAELRPAAELGQGGVWQSMGYTQKGSGYKWAWLTPSLVGLSLAALVSWGLAIGLLVGI